MTNYKKLWRCDECCEIHDDEDGAYECCRPSVSDAFGCLVCSEIHNSKEDAVDCCGSSEVVRCGNCSREYAGKNINAIAVQISGHCTVCNPLFTIDDQLAIQDLYYLNTGRIGDVRLG